MLLNDNTRFIPVRDPNRSESRTVPHQLNLERRIASFDEVEDSYTPEQAAEESARCLKCPTHWCQNACPAGVPVTDFIALARSGQYEEAYRLIRTASMLPEICSRVCPQEKQCQSNCTRSIRGQAVGIGRLERFVTEQHYASGASEPAAEPTGKRVAVIGSGPAGLSAAQRLADLGHAVTVYEKADRPGGLLEYGIPNMKLEKGIVARKVDSLRVQGVVFQTGIQVGMDVTADQLTAEYDAVVLAVGTGNARRLSLDGVETVKGIVPAVEYLTAATRAVRDGMEPISAKGRHVVIIGGGDTGSDCVGTALRQDAASITQLEMLPEQRERKFLFEPHPPQAKEEKHDFSQEECKAVFGDPRIYQTTVKAVSADAEGALQSVTTVDLEPVYDHSFRLTMREIPGTEKTLPCELLLIAAGFVGPDSALMEAFGVQTTTRTNADAPEYQTSTEKVFACGDCRTGQSLVVKAMVDGRKCADCVDACLRK